MQFSRIVYVIWDLPLSGTVSFWQPESSHPVRNLFFEVFLKKTFGSKISNSVYVIWDLPLSGTVSFRAPESTHPVGQIFFEVFGWPSGFEFGDFLEVYAEVYAGISLEGFMQNLCAN